MLSLEDKKIIVQILQIFKEEGSIGKCYIEYGTYFNKDTIALYIEVLDSSKYTKRFYPTKEASVTGSIWKAISLLTDCNICVLNLTDYKGNLNELEEL